MAKQNETDRQEMRKVLSDQFRTSSFCESGGCVSVATKGVDSVIVRSTVTGKEIGFTKTEWQAFTAGVKANEFELA